MPEIGSSPFLYLRKRALRGGGAMPLPIPTPTPTPTPPTPTPTPPTPTPTPTPPTPTPTPTPPTPTPTPPAPLPTFAYEAESNAIFADWAAKGATVSTGRKYHVNHFVRKLKAANIWSAFIQCAIYHYGSAAYDTTNWANPGTYNPVFVGAPTYYSPGGTNNGVPSYLGTASAYIDLTVPISAIPRDSHALYTWLATPTPAGNNEFGAVNASSQGYAFAATSSNAGNLRSSTAAVSFTSTNMYTGNGLFGFSRTGATECNVARNLTRPNSLTTATVDLTSSSLTLHALGLNNNGTHSAPGHRGSAMFIFNRALTLDEERILHDAYRTLWTASGYGEPDIREAGYAPAENSFDVVVYGATASAFTFAAEAKAQGLSVAIVGGWREQSVTQLGGMSAAGGLGSIDWNNTAQIGGLTYDIFNAAVLASSNTWDTSRPKFNPDMGLRQMLKQIDPAKGGADIPIFYSDGLDSVTTAPVTLPGSISSEKITSFTTLDGRTFTARYFHDATYTGELAAAAGLTMVIGREAANAVSPPLANPANDAEKLLGGYRGPSATQPTAFIDPYVTPGVPASGVIFGVDPAPPPLAVGDADPDRCQMMCFRVSLTTRPYEGLPVAVAGSPPPNYDATRYEAIGRIFAAGDVTIFKTTDDPAQRALFIANPVGNNLFDFNNAGSVSLNYYGGSTAKDYYDAVLSRNYALAEQIRQDHVDWTLGLFYWLAQSGDVRIPTIIRDQMRTYYWPATHYYDGNDPYYRLPHVLYEREGARIDGDYKLNANDITEAYPTTTPRISINTAAVASYTMDHHFFRRFVDPVSGSVKNEGGLNEAGTGANNMTPLPVEIALPKIAECSNLSLSFAISTTSLAFGATRMEMTACQYGQSLAVLTALQAAAGDAALQQFNASAFRTASLAPLKGSVPPVLPQTE